MIPWPLAELLPHAGEMILIDQVDSCDDEQIHTRTMVRQGGLFNRADGSLPAWFGIELMAQSVAAFAGCRARRNGQPVALGFLLGTRKYQCDVEHFPLGAELPARHPLAGRRQRHGCVRMPPARPRRPRQRPAECLYPAATCPFSGRSRP